MIAYLKGELVVIAEESIVMEVNHIGYHVKVPASVLSCLPVIGSQVKIHTYTYVREDTFSLYGFLSIDDLNMFKLLITVNGIGPKAGLAILSCMSGDELRIAIISQDAKAISKAPGVGAKTASRVILDLKDKVSLEDTLIGKESQAYQEELSGGNMVGITNEAVEALVSLGYSASDALKAVKKVSVNENMSVEDLLKLSLKNLF